MGKKPFINKKTAVQFRLMSSGTMPGENVLAPTKPNVQFKLGGDEEHEEHSDGEQQIENAENRGRFEDCDEEEEEEYEEDAGSYAATKQSTRLEYGLPDDGYDYDQHLKVGGGGNFVAVLPEFDKSAEEAMQTEGLPEDVLRALMAEDTDDENGEQAGFVEGKGDLEDDFVSCLIDGQQGPSRPRPAVNRFADADDDDYSDDGSEDCGPRGQTLLDDQFERALAEYDDDDIGSLDGEDPEVQGNEDIAKFESVLDEFLDTTRKSHGGTMTSGSTAQSREGGENADGECVELMSKKQNSNFEDVVFFPARQHGGTVRVRDEDEESDPEQYEKVVVSQEEQWDCETIISTYSNLENHPGLITDKVVRKTPIILGKRGMPKMEKSALATVDDTEVTDEQDEQENKQESVATNASMLVPRSRSETAEEKKQRKQIAKELKEMRLEKKRVSKEVAKMEKEKKLKNPQNQNQKGLAIHRL